MRREQNPADTASVASQAPTLDGTATEVPTMAEPPCLVLKTSDGVALKTPDDHAQMWQRVQERGYICPSELKELKVRDLSLGQEYGDVYERWQSPLRDLSKSRKFAEANKSIEKAIEWCQDAYHTSVETIENVTLCVAYDTGCDKTAVQSWASSFTPRAAVSWSMPGTDMQRSRLALWSTKYADARNEGLSLWGAHNHFVKQRELQEASQASAASRLAEGDSKVSSSSQPIWPYTEEYLGSLNKLPGLSVSRRSGGGISSTYSGSGTMRQGYEGEGPMQRHFTVISTDGHSTPIRVYSPLR